MRLKCQPQNYLLCNGIEDLVIVLNCKVILVREHLMEGTIEHITFEICDRQFQCCSVGSLKLNSDVQSKKPCILGTLNEVKVIKEHLNE